jgi:hypothetical protein
VAPTLIILREHIEQKRLNVKVQRLMVQEQLGDQTQILAVDFARVAINLEHTQLSGRITVDLAAWRRERRPLARLLHHNWPLVQQKLSRQSTCHIIGLIIIILSYSIEN